MPESSSWYLEVARVARGMVTGEIDFVDGVRTLNGLRLDGSSEPEDPFFDSVAGLESETDGFPTGELRAEYQPDYLNQLDSDLAKYLEMVRPAFLRKCDELAEKYEALGRGLEARS